MNFEKCSIVPAIFCCDGGSVQSCVQFAHAKSFTSAIYSTHVVLLTKRAVT